MTTVMKLSDYARVDYYCPDCGVIKTGITLPKAPRRPDGVPVDMCPACANLLEDGRINRDAYYAPGYVRRGYRWSELAGDSAYRRLMAAGARYCPGPKHKAAPWRLPGNLHVGEADALRWLAKKGGQS